MMPNINMISYQYKGPTTIAVNLTTFATARQPRQRVSFKPTVAVQPVKDLSITEKTNQDYTIAMTKRMHSSMKLRPYMHYPKSVHIRLIAV